MGLMISLLVCSIVAWRAFGVLVNPISVYMLVWGAVLGLYGTGLIQYAPLSESTTTLAAIAAVALSVGGLLGLRSMQTRSPRVSPTAPFEWSAAQQARHLQAIAATSLLGSVAIIPGFVRVVQNHGWDGLLSSSYRIYLDRVSGAIDDVFLGSLLPPFALAGTLLSSVYVRKYGFRWLVLAPVVLSILHALAFGGRNSLVIPAILLLSPNFILPKARRGRILRRLLVVLPVAVLVALAANANSSAEDATVISSGASSRMVTLSNSFPGIYKAFVYATVPLAVLNHYLRDPYHVFGVNTFFPLFAQLNRLGFALPTWSALPFVDVPMSANVGTYLMELMIDFGYFGAILFVFALGWATGRTWTSVEARDSVVSNSLLAVTNLLLSLSFFMWYGRSYSIWVMVVVSLVASRWIDYSPRLVYRLPGCNGRKSVSPPVDARIGGSS